MLSEAPFTRASTPTSAELLADLAELPELENQLDAYSKPVDDKIARQGLQNTLDFLVERANDLLTLLSSSVTVQGNVSCLDFTADDRVVVTDFTSGVCDVKETDLAIVGNAITGGLDDGTGVVIGSVPTGAATGSALQAVTLTTAERDNLVGVNGMVVYNSTTAQFEGFNTIWDALAGGIGGTTGALDNSMLRADGGGGSTVQAVVAPAVATITDPGNMSVFGLDAGTVAPHRLANRKATSGAGIHVLSLESHGSSHVDAGCFMSLSGGNSSSPTERAIIFARQRAGSLFGELRLQATSSVGARTNCFAVTRDTNFAYANAEGFLGINPQNNPNLAILVAGYGYLYIDSNNDALCYVVDGATTGINLTGNLEAGATVTQNTSLGGAIVTQEGNEFTIVLPGAGAVPVTVVTPFIPGACFEIQVVVSVDASGGTLTNIGVGDGTDPNRWGDLASFVQNAGIDRSAWTINNEQQFGFYLTVTQAGVVNIVLTPTGNWGGGTIVIVIMQKASTVITY